MSLLQCAVGTGWLDVCIYSFLFLSFNIIVEKGQLMIYDLGLNIEKAVIRQIDGFETRIELNISDLFLQ